MSKPRVKVASEHRHLPDFVYWSDAAEVSAILSTKPCQVKDLIITNNTSTAGFVHVFDSETLPADGATPLLRLGLPATNTGTASVGSVWVDNDLFFEKGCVVCISTTFATKTISANAAYFNANISE
jgi:hypothetical protein